MEALAALEGEERSRAEDMLLQYLPDTRGVTVWARWVRAGLSPR